jgi:hypothetical protein
VSGNVAFIGSRYGRNTSTVRDRASESRQSADDTAVKDDLFFFDFHRGERNVEERATWTLADISREAVF